MWLSLKKLLAEFERHDSQHTTDDTDTCTYIAIGHLRHSDQSSLHHLENNVCVYIYM